ncbi:acetyltransferase [uncultured Cetobacterium sp.]|uniref:acetyltransferase n=1 Tax=uncultured Cetobacterium sp. TaxID=527638 RepID=UPI00261326BB|nr:acetyltransferase [uncultured Cetobacterium sp.]
MKKVIVIGSGGHAKVIIDIILQRNKILDDNLNIIGILDDKYNEDEKIEIFETPIIGKIEKMVELAEDIHYIIAIGNNSVRRKIAEKYSDKKFITLIHPKAIIGEKVKIEEGTVVMAGSIINSYTKIGKHCILNTGSIIEHDNTIEDYVHISPNATLCGGVMIKEEAWIGAGATIIQEKKIGKKVMVGAGAVVIKNLQDQIKVIGVPTKIL